MLTTPNPVPASQASSAEQVDRDLDCSHYDDCLDRAVREGWSGFACHECPIRGLVRRGELAVEAFLAGPGNLRASSPKACRRDITPASPIKGGFYLEVYSRFTDHAPRWTYRELAQAMGQPPSRVTAALAHLVGRAMLVRVGPGTYERRKGATT